MSERHETACSDCHHFFNVETGEIVKGWERVYVVSAGPYMCGRCKEEMINGLVRGVTL